MKWNGRKPPCYEYRPESHAYVFHVSEKESVVLVTQPYYSPERMFVDNVRAPLVRLLTGVSPVEMLSDPAKWARFYGSKRAEDRPSEEK